MRRFLAVLVLCALAGCSSGDSPVEPDTLSLQTSVADFSSDVAALVSSVPSVVVRNQRGAGVSGVMVHFAVLTGGGRVAVDSVRTNVSGVASSGGWTLGPLAGVQTMQATAPSLAPVLFTATAVASTPTRLVRVTPALASLTVGSVVSQPLTVRAEDAYGNAVANVPVLFSVIAGGGTLSSAPATTNASGLASAGAWTLGTAAGAQAVRATGTGLAGADIDILATAAAASSMVLVAGDNQSVQAGSVVPQPPVVRVLDRYGNNVGGVTVTFTPGTGSGTVTGGTVVTDAATGTAIVSSWTLGSAAAQTLVATSPALPASAVTFRATVAVNAFNINVRFIGDGGTDRQRQAFALAASRWQRVITSNVGATQLNAPAGECTSWIPAVKEITSSLLIYVRLASIDGPGKILGQASPCYINSSNKLTILGFFELDIDDLDLLLTQGTLDNVVLHEMGHILGIGTLWSYQRNLLTGRGTADPYFTGPLAQNEFRAIGGFSYAGLGVPVENLGQAGTRDSHWRKEIFSNELMQGYVARNGMPMSRMTIASLADLGYGVSYTSADNFSFFASLSALPAGEPVSMGNDVVDGPLFEVSPTGTRRRVR